MWSAWGDIARNDCGESPHAELDGVAIPRSHLGRDELQTGNLAHALLLNDAPQLRIVLLERHVSSLHGSDGIDEMLFRDGAEIDLVADPAAINEIAVASYQKHLSKGCEKPVDGGGHAR